LISFRPFVMDVDSAPHSPCVPPGLLHYVRKTAF
jgi:hypothetical protein